MARLGDLDLNPTINDGATPLDVPIEKIISHARYFVGYKLVNDISLLKLKESVTFTSKWWWAVAIFSTHYVFTASRSRQSIFNRSVCRARRIWRISIGRKAS